MLPSSGVRVRNLAPVFKDATNIEMVQRQAITDKVGFAGHRKRTIFSMLVASNRDHLLVENS